MSQSISSILIKPAGPDCNLACTYCFYRPTAALFPGSPHTRMSLAVLRQLVAQYMDMSETPAFCWQGGEPMLMGVDFYRSVIAMQKKYGHPGQVVSNSLQTNGILVDEEWARLLARYNFLVGVSIDGPEDIHDHYRRNMGGQPTLARVLRGVRILARHGVEYNALCMATPLSTAQPQRVFDFLREQKIDYMQFIPCVERDPRSGELAEFCVRPEQYGDFLCAIFDLWLPLREEVHVRLFEDLLAGLMGRPEIKSCLFRPSCGEYVVVEHNGDVFACDFFVDRPHRLGNMTEKPLAELVEEPLFAEFAAAKGDLAPECRACSWLKECYGACPKHRVFAGGGAGAKNFLCEAYRRIFAYALPKLRPVAKEYLKRSAEAGSTPGNASQVRPATPPPQPTGRRPIHREC